MLNSKSLNNFCCLLILILFLNNKFVKAQQVDERVHSLIQTYQQSLKNNDANAALNSINQLIQIDSNEASYYYARALLNQFINDSNFNLIIVDYNKAIELNQNSTEYYFKRGEFLWQQLKDDKTKLAIADFKKSLLLDSTNFEAYQKLHDYYIFRDTKEAAKIRKLARMNMQKMVDKDSTNAQNWFLLARSFDLLEDGMETKTINDKCFLYYSKAIELDQTQYEYYWERGVKNYFYKMNYHGCIDDMTKAIALHQSPLYHIYIALCYDRLRDKEKAMAAIDEGLIAFPDYWQLVQTKNELQKKVK